MSHDATNWAIKQRGIKPALKVVLWNLCDRYHPDNGCFPSQDTLAADCEVSRSALNTHLDDLEGRGLIAREQRRKAGSNRQERTRYRFAFEADFKAKPAFNSNEKPSPDSGHGDGEAVSRNQGEPCPENGESRVQNLDSNLVKEPVREPVKERERAREDLEDRNAIPGTAEFRKRVQCFLSGEGYHEGEWPKWAKSTTIDYITRHFAALPEPDRKLAEHNRDAFLAKCRTDGGQVMGAGNYFRDRAWEPLSDRDRKLPERAPEPDKAFSKAWMGLELSLLMAAEAPLPRMTSYLQGVVLQGGPMADAVRREHRMRYAWPRVTEMHNGYKPVRVPPEIVKSSDGFKSYNLSRDAEIVDAWKRLYEYRGWPWPSVRDDGWICFPETAEGTDAGVDTALGNFVATMTKGRDNEHAA